MLFLPPLKTGKRCFPVRRVGDDDQRHSCSGLFGRAFRPRWCHPRSLSFPFAEVGRPRSVRQARRLVPCGEFEQPFERTGDVIHPGVGIADLMEASRHRRHRKIGRVAVGDLFPSERRRHARIGKRSHRIGRAGRSVLGILVVIEKDSPTLLLPPPGGGEPRHPPLDLPRQGQRRPPDLRERPSWQDPNVHVDAPRTTRLRPPLKPDLLQERLHLHCNAANVGPGDPRCRVEINPQFVRMIEIAGADRMRVEFDAAEVHDPGETRPIVDDHLFRRAS